MISFSYHPSYLSCKSTTTTTKKPSVTADVLGNWCQTVTVLCEAMHAGHVRSVFLLSFLFPHFVVVVNLCIMIVLYNDCIVQPHHRFGIYL